MSYACFLLSVAPACVIADETVISGDPTVEGGTEVATGTASQVDSLVKEGISLYEQGNYEGAIQRFEKALESEPNNVFAVYELALTYMRLGNFESAHRIINRGLTSGIDNMPELYTLSASALDNLGRTEEAISTFDTGIERFPQNYGLRLNLGITYLRLSRAAAARDVLEQAISIDPHHPSGHLLLGQIYAMELQTIPAILALGRSLSLESDGSKRLTAARLIKKIMDDSIGITQGGIPIIVMDVMMFG